MFIEIKSNETRTETTRNGKLLYKQQAALCSEQGQDYPIPFNLTHLDPEHAYKPGRYQFAVDSFKMNPWGGIELDQYNIRLVPAMAAAKAA